MVGRRGKEGEGEGGREGGRERDGVREEWEGGRWRKKVVGRRGEGEGEGRC